MNYSVRAVLNTGERIEGVMHTRISGHVVVDGIDYLREFTTSEGIPGAKKSYRLIRASEGGVYVRAPDRPESLLLPRSTAPGTRWTAKTEGGLANYSIGPSEDVDTGTEIFRDCLVVTGERRARNLLISERRYYARGVGEVRSVTTRAHPSGAKLVSETLLTTRIGEDEISEVVPK